MIMLKGTTSYTPTSTRAVAPTPAGPAMAGPVFASGAKILKTEVMHFKHTFSLGGGATKGNTMF